MSVLDAPQERWSLGITGTTDLNSGNFVSLGSSLSTEKALASRQYARTDAQSLLENLG